MQSNKNPEGGVVFAYHVSDPERYGWWNLKDLNALSIEEEKNQLKRANPILLYMIIQW
jgi:dTDP-glucose pyrophosphorylase